MATAGEIAVNLTANSRGFRTGIDQARGSLTGLTSAIGTVKTALVGFLSVSAIRSAVNSLTDTVKRLDDLAAESDRLGVSTEFLSEMHFAAKLSDTEIESLNGGIEKLEKHLGKATVEGSDLTKMLARLELDAKTLADSGPEEAFLTIADTISRIPDAFQRATFAESLFGKSSTSLLGILSKSRGEIQKLRDEAKAMGLSLSGADAGKIGRADDAMKRMGAAVDSIKHVLAIELAPEFEKLVPLAKDLASVLKDLLIPAVRASAAAFVDHHRNVNEFDDAARKGDVKGALLGPQGKPIGLKPGGFLDRLFGGDGLPIGATTQEAALAAGAIAKEAINGLDLGGPELKGRHTNKPGDVFSKEGFDIIASAITKPAVNVQKEMVLEQKKSNKKLDDVNTNLGKIKLPAVAPNF